MDDKTREAIVTTRKNREALRRNGMDRLTQTGDGPLSKEPLGIVVRYRFPNFGLCYVTPLNRYQIKGHNSPTTEFRFASDDEMPARS